MTRRKTNEEYVKECKSKGYDLPVEEYINSRTKINHLCGKCGNVYNQTPHSHLNGNGCPKCYGTPKKTMEEYIKDCKKLSLDLPISNEKYRGNKVKIKHICKNNHVYSQSPNSHLTQKQGCPKCGRIRVVDKLVKTTQQYVKECNKMGIDLPIEEYKGSRVPIKHKCSKGHIYKQIPYMRLYYGCGCPICNQPRGEHFIQNYLNINNISYAIQKTFNDLKDKTYLSYDFYLPKKKVLIEYQGLQHYEAKDYFGGKKQLKKQQYHDKLKHDYALNNGYTLLEPTYKLNTQEKVNNYLDKHLKS